ncbi:hypothetical protein KUV86_19515 [Halomonas sp. DP8Y7-3]|uniref:hypothetical protein n=1 Tax=Halomonas sp. DP8Y7-3 TaxID=2859079 RepID=UPI001C96922C|nr:hypothetical protein [Halomonas sp. DP8Y7-3]MBY5931291.1 hypothetical protein [Halomonas sp. DP8Y7-3]
MIRRNRSRWLGVSNLPWGMAALALGASALLAVWLLLEPWLISGLTLPARVLMVGLGLWVVGVGLALPLCYPLVTAPTVGASRMLMWLRRASAAPWYPLALAIFVTLLLARSIGVI